MVDNCKYLINMVILSQKRGKSMIRTREELEHDLQNEFWKIASDSSIVRELSQDAYTSYRIPEIIFTDYITLRKDTSEADLFTLFILTDIVLNTIENYFSSTEISEFHETKWHNKEIKFPLRLKMTKINDEQFIGKITVKELMGLKDARYINYNENVQRTKRRIIRGDTEFYQIFLNKRAVSEIIDSFESDLYIPNTITLNMPDGTLYNYNEKEGILEIKEIDYFDILDGYHRYIAMSKIASRDPDFDYAMELRIVKFPESKARRFIWQEDQKTKMRKIDSDSMNPVKTANKIVSRINMDDKFILSGKISRNKGIINAAYLADIIDILFVRRTLKSEEGIIIRNTTTRIISYIEDFVITHEEYLNTPWDRITTLVVIYDYYRGNFDHILEDIEKVKENGTIYQTTKLQKADITKLKKILPEGGE